MLNYILEAIHQPQLDLIVQEVKKPGIDSIQIDATQDITTTDQCSVIIRYVTDQVHERLLAFVASYSGITELLRYSFSNSYLRMNAWKGNLSESKGSHKLKHLQAIGTTRWWSKDRALKIFWELEGSFQCIICKSY
ncbi:hypothetical protein LOD99_14619 [Oopsacas minuta]|uniref:Uncharacterized protein n=1 Tax=Oopsacas minuta TaxID=111878 RepID=A0AAV7KGK0_9METZ|nr:hypothetical protein LOD99_14619 [Oopsacas minuta]